MLRAGGLLDVLTPLSGSRQESVEMMERRIPGVSYMCWMDFHNAILCCGFLCTRSISSYFLLQFLLLFCVYLVPISRLPRRGLPRPIYTARAITPLPPLHGYHACVYLSRLPRHSSFLYPWVITPGLSLSTTLVHRVITPGIVVRILQFTFHRLLRHLFFSTYTTTGAPHVPTYSTR